MFPESPTQKDINDMGLTVSRFLRQDRVDKPPISVLIKKTKNKRDLKINILIPRK